jgi:hypothetical protein
VVKYENSLYFISTCKLIVEVYVWSSSQWQNIHITNMSLANKVNVKNPHLICWNDIVGLKTVVRIVFENCHIVVLSQNYACGVVKAVFWLQAFLSWIRNISSSTRTVYCNITGEMFRLHFYDTAANFHAGSCLLWIGNIFNFVLFGLESVSFIILYSGHYTLFSFMHTEV